MKRHLIILLAFFATGCCLAAYASQSAVDGSVVLSYSKAVQACNPAAIKAVFALNIDGAAPAETRDIVLGGIITKCPRRFLEELQQSQASNGKAWLPGLLGNLGIDYVDRPTAQVVELKKRRDALRSVHDKSLAELQNKCVAELDRQIQQLQQMLHPHGG